MRCQVKKCENRAMLLYGSKWICGECFMKIFNKLINDKNKQIEEIEND